MQESPPALKISLPKLYILFYSIGVGVHDIVVLKNIWTFDTQKNRLNPVFAQILL